MIAAAPFRALALAGAVTLVLCACERKEEAKAPPPTSTPDALTLTPVAFADLPGWTADRVSDALPALAKSCARFASQPPDRPVGPNGIAGTLADWQPPCAKLAAVPPGDDTAARRFFETHFTPYAAANNSDRNGLFTGYYEVELEGSRSPDLAYPVPLYKRPADLVMVDLGDFAERWKGDRTAGRVIDGRLKPFEDRAAIEAGALRGKGLELVWLKDPIAAFFLHIQGSGRVRMADGSEMRVGYAAQNGHTYVAIGKISDRPGRTETGRGLASDHPRLADRPSRRSGGVDEQKPLLRLFPDVEGRRSERRPGRCSDAGAQPGRGLQVPALWRAGLARRAGPAGQQPALAPPAGCPGHRGGHPWAGAR